MRPAVYVEDKSGQEWFCTSHQRRATHVRERDGYHCCDQALGGICIPCDCRIVVDGPSRIVDALVPGMIR